MIAPHAGFWGVPTSTVDWCEANYAVTPYVAEFFNTVSSLAMVAVGVAGAWAHRRVLERRFLAAFGLVALVGLGSIAFHATLLRGLQMLDELPMLYLVLLIVFILVENDPTRRWGRWFPALLWAYAAVLTVMCTFTRGRVEFFVFQVSFGSLEFYALGRVFWLQRKLGDPNGRRLFRVGIACYVSAMAAWLTDLKGCRFVSVALPLHGIPNPQLHAVWHVLVSFGFYALLLVIALDRAERLGTAVSVGWWPLPRLRGREVIPARLRGS